MGSQITRLALPFQVYALTGSTLAIAALTVVQLVPLLVFALAAGSLADAVDKRRLLLATQVGLAVTSGALVVLALQGDPPLVLLFVVAFFAAGLTSVDQPTRASSIPRLVPAERLPAAMALNQLNYQAASIIGPAFGGILIATVGLPGAYAIDVLTFVASFVALLVIRPLPPLGRVTRPGLAAVREGLAFVRRRPVLMGTFVIDLNAMILASPIALFPAIALDIFRVGPAGLGILAAAPAAGAFVGALLSGWVPRVRRVGRALVIVVALWGLAMAGFGVAVLLQAIALAPLIWTFPLGLVLLAVAGAVDMFSAVFRNTILQLTTPDELRGRVTSIHILVVTGGPRLGDIQAALVAAAVGPGLAVVAGGLLCVLGVGVSSRRIPSLPAHVLGEGAEELPART
ncbi:MAG: MFS transporter [Chloroflexi bacterium]|nr:MFS transporter [Chloroflexota bacterium]